MMQKPSLPDIFKTLQTTLHTIEDWCKEHKLQISKDKSALMTMFTRNRKEFKRHSTIAPWGIKIVSKMRYLGVMLACQLDWYPHTQHLENKLLRIRNNLVRCSKATWGMSFHNLMTIYKYAILPAITYASEARSISMSKTAKSKMQQIQRSFLIFIKKGLQKFHKRLYQQLQGSCPSNKLCTCIKT